MGASALGRRSRGRRRMARGRQLVLGTQRRGRVITISIGEQLCFLDEPFRAAADVPARRLTRDRLFFSSPFPVSRTISSRSSHQQIPPPSQSPPRAHPSQQVDSPSPPPLPSPIPAPNTLLTTPAPTPIPSHHHCPSRPPRRPLSLA
jgi:hypothetical protein